MTAVKKFGTFLFEFFRDLAHGFYGKTCLITWAVLTAALFFVPKKHSDIDAVLYAAQLFALWLAMYAFTRRQMRKLFSVRAEVKQAHADLIRAHEKMKAFAEEVGLTKASQVSRHLFN